MDALPGQTVIDPMLLIPAVVTGWIGVATLIACLAGWPPLAGRFRTIQPATGQAFRFASGAIGASRHFPVNCNNCLFLAVGPAGLRISLLFIFRVLSPALLIPWSAIETVDEERRWLVRYTVIHIRGFEIRVRVRGKPGARIAGAWRRYAARGGHPTHSGA